MFQHLFFANNLSIITLSLNCLKDQVQQQTMRTCSESSFCRFGNQRYSSTVQPSLEKSWSRMNTLIAGRIHYQQVEFATNQPQISYPLFLCYQETGAQAHISMEIIVSRMQSPKHTSSQILRSGTPNMDARLDDDLTSVELCVRRHMFLCTSPME